METTTTSSCFVWVLAPETLPRLSHDLCLAAPESAPRCQGHRCWSAPRWSRWAPPPADGLGGANHVGSWMRTAPTNRCGCKQLQKGRKRVVWRCLATGPGTERHRQARQFGTGTDLDQKLRDSSAPAACPCAGPRRAADQLVGDSGMIQEASLHGSAEKFDR